MHVENYLINCVRLWTFLALIRYYDKRYDTSLPSIYQLKMYIKSYHIGQTIKIVEDSNMLTKVELFLQYTS